MGHRRHVPYGPAVGMRFSFVLLYSRVNIQFSNRAEIEKKKPFENMKPIKLLDNEGWESLTIAPKAHVN